MEKALAYLGETPVITRDREELLAADKVILPGVGALGMQWNVCTSMDW